MTGNASGSSRFRSHRFAALTRLPFLCALLLLLLNDFVLKEAFHNAITGKLSDFAGLFALSYFLLALIGRHHALVLFATGAAFLLWKSPQADGFIQAWNHAMPFSIGRVVDPGDLFALMVLPIASLLVRPRHAVPRVDSFSNIGLRMGIAALAVFAFTATSRVSRLDAPVDYASPIAASALLDALKARGITASAVGTSLLIPLQPQDCDRGAEAVFAVETAGGISRLRLLHFESSCDLEKIGRLPLFRTLHPILSGVLRAERLKPFEFPRAIPKECTNGDASAARNLAAACRRVAPSVSG
jgi:hypothetical protein